MKSMIRIVIALLGAGFIGISANCRPEPEPRVIHHYTHHHRSNAPENFEPVNRY